jgi:hypothetical protein
MNERKNKSQKTVTKKGISVGVIKIRKQQIPETVHILNTPLTADIDKHDEDDVTNTYFEG